MGFAGRNWGRQADQPGRWEKYFSSDQFAAGVARWQVFESRGWSGEAQLDAMDIEGIDVAVLYPSRGLYALSEPDLDPRLAAAMARAYNDWLYEFMEADRNRLLGAAMVSPFDVDDAVKETRRAVTELGCKAVFLRSSRVNGRNWHDPYYDPLWAEIAELGVSLGFHEASRSLLPNVGRYFNTNDWMLEHVTAHPLEQMLCLTSFCGSGVLERHPDLRVAFLEGNCSWLPFLLWRMDEHVEWMGSAYNSGLTMMPSDYFKRQCVVSVESDEDPVRYVIEDGYVDQVVYSTDFPHGDSKYPTSVERFLKLPISKDSKRKLLWDNCARFYRVA